MDTQKTIFTVTFSVLITTIVLGSGFYFWQSAQNEKMFSLIEQKNNVLRQEIKDNILKKQDVITEDVVTNIKTAEENANNFLTETHTNRLFTIGYPSDWIKQTNESGGLTAILPPDDDHSVVSVRYVTSYDDIASCDLTTREWPDMKSTIVDTSEGSRLIKYEAINRFQEKEIAFVAVSGEVGSVAHDCTIIDFDDVWTSHKDIAWQIINSVKLVK